MLGPELVGFGPRGWVFSRRRGRLQRGAGGGWPGRPLARSEDRLSKRPSRVRGCSRCGRLAAGEARRKPAARSARGTAERWKPGVRGFFLALLRPVVLCSECVCVCVFSPGSGAWKSTLLNASCREGRLNRVSTDLTTCCCWVKVLLLLPRCRIALSKSLPGIVF